MMQALKTIVVTAIAVFAVTAVAMAGATRFVDPKDDGDVRPWTSPAGGITLTDAQFDRMMDALTARTAARVNERRRDLGHDRTRDTWRGDARHDGDGPAHASRTRADDGVGDRTFVGDTHHDRTPENGGGTCETHMHDGGSHDGGSHAANSHDGCESHH